MRFNVRHCSLTQTELQRLQFDESSGNGVSSSSHKSPYTKIVAESDRLRRDLKREIERNERLQLSLSTLEVQNSKLRQELDEVRYVITNLHKVEL